MRRLIVVCAVVVLFGTGLTKAVTWTTIEYPEARSTTAYGIDGSNIVGRYVDNSGFGHSFVYNGTTWTALNKPGTVGGTIVYGISGNNLVGTCGGNGFLYDGTNWTAPNMPGAVKTLLRGISGSNIVGYYFDASNKKHGFSYDGTNWSTLDVPEAISTEIYGIDGDNIVGSYQDASGDGHGFLYDGATWTTIDFMAINCINGNYLGGSKLYDMTTHTLTTLNAPGAQPGTTVINGISGNTVVGVYTDDASGKTRGFIYEIPEPATLLLLGLGALALRKRI